MADEIRDAIMSARAAHMQLIQKSFSNSDDVLIDEDTVSKAQEDELFLKATDPEDFDKEEVKDKDNDEGEEDVEEAQDADVEKSDIAVALSSSDAPKVVRTGKEIKEHLTDNVIPKLTSELAVKQQLANQLLGNCGIAPTHEPYKWWTEGIEIDCNYKVYDYGETECCSNCGIMQATLSAQDAADKKGNCPETPEQAQCRRDYNDVVRYICNIMVDIKTCEIMQGLKDNEEYELNARQVIALDF